jgi:hypothetical protein
LGHTRRINSSLLTTLPRPSSSYQHVESAPAEPDRPAVGEELAAMRQHLETTERDGRRRFGETFHQLY